MRNLLTSASTPARDAARRRYRPLLSRLYRPPLAPPLSLLYRGDRVECPCCGGTFRKFMPAIKRVGRNRAGARCPGCGVRGRQRLLWLYLEQRTDLFSAPLRVLHVAPEKTLMRKLEAQANLDYVTTDLNRRRAMVRADITDLPFADDAFDAIICSHVLEHVVDDSKAMRELHRVLRPGGWAVVVVPISSVRRETLEDPTIVDPQERRHVFGQGDHVRRYGLDIEKRLEEAGFDVRVEDYARELGAARAKRHGVPAGRPIYRCDRS